jgi:transglutaminase-like putative cysteine protease
MIAILRRMRIPARYVSGYLYHREVGEAGLVDDATHAWVEALLPELGWTGFDPTANSRCAHGHIRTAIGRDYADVPPPKASTVARARSLLSVSVQGVAVGRGSEHTEPDAPAPPAAVEMRQRSAQEHDQLDQ